MKTVVVAFEGLREEQKARLDAMAAGWIRVTYVAEMPKSWEETLQDAEVVFGWPAPEALAKSSVLFHQLPSSGYDSYDVPAIRRKAEFRLANSRGVAARAVAEHALAFLFAFNRELPMHVSQRPNKIWRRMPCYRALKGQTLCIVGLGTIGKELARLAKRLDMHVVAVNRTLPAESGADQVWPLSEGEEPLRRADHVVVTAAASLTQQPLFTEKHFAAMRTGAYFYNVARGSVVDEAALIHALRCGRIAGAGLDVFATEPLPASSPLWEMSNVLITPHAGGRFLEEHEMLCDLFLDNFERYKKSEPLRNVVIGKDV